MKILFLDIDGVLNTHDFNAEAKCGPIHKAKVDLLNGVLRATDARIVLSSAWRYLSFRGEMNLMGLEWLLRSHGVIADRLVGVTREDTLLREPWTGDTPWVHTNERGQQISDWLKENRNRNTWNSGPRSQITQHAVVDDMDLGISEASHPFVHVDGVVGLTAANCVNLCELLLRSEQLCPASSV